MCKESYKMKKGGFFHRFTWILSKYKRENVEKHWLKERNSKNGHYRYSGYERCICRRESFIFMKMKIPEILMLEYFEYTI